MTLRFILRRSTRDGHSQFESSGLYTVDAVCPELEQALCRGGHGPDGFDYHELIGVEVLDQPKEPRP